MQKFISALAAISLVGSLFLFTPAPAYAVTDETYWISYSPTAAAVGAGVSCEEPDWQVTNTDDDPGVPGDQSNYFNDALLAVYNHIDAQDYDDVIINLCDGDSGAVQVYEIDDWANADPTNPTDDALYTIEIRGITYDDQTVPAADGDVVVDGNSTWRSGFDLQDVALTLSNITITDTTDASDGAAVSLIAVDDVTPTLLMEEVVVDSNTTTGEGAVYVEGAVTINDSTFTTNDSTGHGGAVYATGNVTVTDSTFQGNSSDQYGGAIYADGDVTVSGDSVFEDNEADQGGAVYAEGDFSDTDSDYIDNSAEENGGAIAVDGDITLNGALFDGNYAVDEGGAVYSEYEIAVTIENTTFTSNGKGPDGVDLDELPDDYTERGGAIYLYDAGSLTMTDVVFGNSADHSEFNHADQGSDVWSGVGVVTEDPTQLTVSDYVTLYSGSDSMYLECVEGTIDESHFIGSNESAIEVVYDSDCELPGTLRIEDSTFEDTGDSAIRVYDEELERLEVVRSEFLANYSNGDGGAIDVDEVEQVMIADSSFTNNEADDYGGAVYIEDAFDGGVITNSRFVGNSTDDDDGGAVYVEYSPLTIRGSTFRDNISDGDGGAIAMYEGDSLIVDSTFVSNYADSDGGAVSADDGALTIEKSRIEFNESENHGGAIYFYGGDENSLTVIRTALNANIANVDDGSTGAGGAIYAEDVTRVDISGNVITANRARWGGAIHLEIEDTPKQRDLVLVSGIRSNTLKGNSTFNSSVSQFNGGRVLSVVHEVNGAGVCTAVTSGPRIEKQLSKSRNKLTGVRAGHGVVALCSNDPKWESD